MKAADNYKTAPIYYRSGQYAREHGELDKYRETTMDLRMCRNYIESVCAARFDGMHLDTLAVTDVIDMFPTELVSLVLSTTVIDKEWDGRFSRSNKQWAHTIKQTDRDDSLTGGMIVVGTHPAILDGFITMYRKATA